MDAATVADDGVQLKQVPRLRFVGLRAKPKPLAQDSARRERRHV
jgi:hypothetical protein